MDEWAVATEMVGVLGWAELVSVALGLTAEAATEALCLIGMSAEALTEQAAQTEATAPSMGFAEVGIAASTENSVWVATLTETPQRSE